MNDDAAPDAPSPHRVDGGTWSKLVAELGADKPPKKKAGARSPKASSSAPAYEPREGRSAWEIALSLAGRLGPQIGDGKFAIVCVNDAEHTQPPPDREASRATGSCVLFPPAPDSIFGLPRCSHAHCQSIPLRRWIEAVGYEVWERAVVEARGWRVARDWLLHDDGISGFKRIPFALRDGEDTVEGGLQQVVPAEGSELTFNFWARITCDVTEHDVATTRRFYELEARVSDRTRRFRIPAEAFSSMGWVATELGPEAVIATAQNTVQKLRAAIQFLSMPVPRREVYTMTGWRQVGGENVYLHAGGAIAEGGAVPDVSVSLAGEVLNRFRLPEPPEGAELLRAVEASALLFGLGAPTVSVPLFGSVWRAALGASPLTIYLSAPPTTGKSLLAALAQQHFGAAMHEGALPASVKHSTAASLNALRSLVGDAVFVVDDYLVSGNMAEDLKLAEKLDNVIRAQYGGTGAQRLARDGSLATTGSAPRSTLILTGETLPRGNSLRSRFLVLELPGRIAESLDGVKSAAARGLYASAMAAFVRWLAPRIEGARRTLRDDVMEAAARLRRDVPAGEGDHRTALLLAEVEVGVRYFLAFARDVGLSPAAVDEIEALTARTLRAMALEQLGHRAAQDPALRFCELLGAALSAGRCYLTLPNGTAPEDPTRFGWRVAGSSPKHEVPDPGAGAEDDENEIPFDTTGTPPLAPKPEDRPRAIMHRALGDCLGTVDPRTGRLWFKPEIGLKLARGLATEIGDPLPLSAEDLARRLYDHGLLAATELKTRRTYTVRKNEVTTEGASTTMKGGYLCMHCHALGIDGFDPPLSAMSALSAKADTGRSE